MKPRFLISFRYTNYPFFRPERPYLVPLNDQAYAFRLKFYGQNGIRFTSIKCQ